MAYSDKVLDHYNQPRNVGSLPKDDQNVGTGVVGAPECGDVMKLQIRVNAEGVIEDARFKTFGCGSAIASSSLATEWVKGKTVEEAAAIAFEGTSPKPSATGQDAWALLEATASGNLADAARDRMIEQARTRITAMMDTWIADYARQRADALAEDHGRVRAAGINVPRVTVEPVLPADVMGAFALVPGGF